MLFLSHFFLQCKTIMATEPFLNVSDLRRLQLEQLEQACIMLLDAPHHDHFASRLGDDELAAVERMKRLLKDRALISNEQQATDYMRMLTPEQRLEVSGKWCRGCGGTHPCCCQNDE